MADRDTYSDDDLVAPRVAAQIMGVSADTVRRWSDGGLLPVLRTLGNQRRYRVGDLRAALTADDDPEPNGDSDLAPPRPQPRDAA